MAPAPVRPFTELASPRIPRRRRAVFILIVATSFIAACRPPTSAPSEPPPSNIILIVADDLGYGDLGCYGQKDVLTPNLDRMAAEGTRFTHFYSGSSSCMPSRYCLLTGVHTGHALIRANRVLPMRAEDVTIAEAIRPTGRRNAIIGKWGLGLEGSTGFPLDQGFDEFYGMLAHKCASEFYPQTIWRGREEIAIDQDMPLEKRYVQTLLTDAAVECVHRNRQTPFFLLIAFPAPHISNNDRFETPSHGVYESREWTDERKSLAALITWLDGDVGRILAQVREDGLDDRTITFFTSDNGCGVGAALFQSNGPLNGLKFSLYEGGIRVPMIARWPGRIPAGAASDFAWAFWDLLPTVCGLVGAPPPGGLDGIDVRPTLFGRPQRPHEHLYWETHELGKFIQAVRVGEFKALRYGLFGPPRVFDVVNDPAETTDLAASDAQRTEMLTGLLRSARTSSPLWPVSGEPPP